MRSQWRASISAWADAEALIRRFDERAHQEALLRAGDPLGADYRHWTRVAAIIAWRTGQDDGEAIAPTAPSRIATAATDAHRRQARRPTIRAR